MRLIAFLLAALVLSACSRPLAQGETAFAADLFGESFDPSRARITAGLGLTPLPRDPPLPGKIKPLKPRPGFCDRTEPGPPEFPPAAFVLYQRVHIAARFYRADTLPGWPGRILLPQALILAHEFTHVWQWQNRARTGYRPMLAALESLFNFDPYFYVPGDGAGFLRYGYEQQAALVEDYLCYGLYDPQNPRRAELHAILAPLFPVDRLDAALAR